MQTDIMSNQYQSNEPNRQITKLMDQIVLITTENDRLRKDLANKCNLADSS